MYNLHPEEPGMITQVFMPKNMVSEIDRIAKDEGISRSAFMRRAVLKEMKKIDQENNTGTARQSSPVHVQNQPEESKPHEDSTKY
jgi:metal-responsive CopG/Arc/MetJ family transcriptional regulator